MNHVKPTKEELEAQVKLDIEEAEKLSKETPKPEEEPEVPVVPEVEVPETPPVVEVEEEEVEEKKPEPKEIAEEKTTRLEKENKASSREAQKIYAKNRVMNQAVIDAELIPEPTEEELQTEYKDWEVMSDIERTLAKETVITKKWRAKIKEAGDQATKIEKWNESVDAFIGDPIVITANPALEGKQEAFAEFASKQENNSVPFKILISAFLFEESTKKGHKGQMFPTGSGGPNEKPTPKSDKLTIEEGRALRETDYGAWKEKLKAGKLSTDI